MLHPLADSPVRVGCKWLNLISEWGCLFLISSKNVILIREREGGEEGEVLNPASATVNNHQWLASAYCDTDTLSRPLWTGGWWWGWKAAVEVPQGRYICELCYSFSESSLHLNNSDKRDIVVNQSNLLIFIWLDQGGRWFRNDKASLIWFRYYFRTSLFFV